jgi:hypothetical protein
VKRRSGQLGCRVTARVRLIAKTVAAFSALTLATSCSSGTAPLPPVAGNYIVTVTVTWSAAGDSVQSHTLQPGSFLLDSASRTGSFVGGYEIGGVTGEMAGQEAANGSLRFSSFGSYNSAPRPPLENDELVAEVLPGCDWSTAANGEMTAQVVHSAGGAASSVTFTGSVQVQCTVSGSSSPVTSTVTLTGSGAQSSGGLYP